VKVRAGRGKICWLASAKSSIQQQTKQEKPMDAPEDTGWSYGGVGNKMDGDVSAAMRERTAEDSQEDIWGEMAQGFIRQGRNAARPDF
jgi:hypothetical protein